jgi:uncharacterized phosphosugar-binding protein
MTYLSEIRRLLDLVEATQSQAVYAAAELVADAITGQHLFHVFGTGHAHILAEELFYRAGGLLPVDPILDSGLMLHDGALASSQVERLPGYAKVIFSKHNLEAGDAILIASNSGVNAAPVEGALEARQLGLKVIALTSLTHSRAVPARHSSGAKLYELADVVIDNCGCTGDAVLEIEGLPGKIEATSTVIGATLLHWLEHETVKILMGRGITPEIAISSNVPGGDAHNAAGFARYRGRVRCL